MLITWLCGSLWLWTVWGSMLGVAVFDTVTVGVEAGRI